MKETYTCTKIKYNSAMAATMCYENDLIFFFDYFDMVKVGDTVTIEKDEKENNKNVWVNGQLKDLNKAAKECEFRPSKNRFFGI